jgi:hypothetical protein
MMLRVVKSNQTYSRRIVTLTWVLAALAAVQILVALLPLIGCH